MHFDFFFLPGNCPLVKKCCFWINWDANSSGLQRSATVASQYQYEVEVAITEFRSLLFLDWKKNLATYHTTKQIGQIVFGIWSPTNVMKQAIEL